MIEVNEWWSVLESYNVTIFPLQIILFTLSIIAAAWFLVHPGETADKIIKGYLGITFAWIGIVFFLLCGKNLPAYPIQAGLFLTLSALFSIDIFRNRIRFKRPSSKWKMIITSVGFLAVFLYPLCGYIFGHEYPKFIILGTFPCPTVAFALLFMTLAIPDISLILFILLFIWAIPFPIFIQIPQFGVYEDAIMLIIGIYSLMLFLFSFKRKKIKETV